MQMTPVESSNVKAVGYDPDTRVMRIEFHSGGIYDHSDVPASDHQIFMAAGSKGKHYHRHIRGVHASSKIK